VNLSSVKLGRAFGIIMKTTPLLLVRLGAYIIFWAATMIYLALVGGVAWLLGSLWGPLGFIAFIAGLVGIGPLYQLAYQYVFYILKAAYIAVAAQFIVHGKLPDGAGGQLEWGRQAVTQRFGQASAMFVVDELVNGVIRSFTRSVWRFSNMLPGETMENLARVANRVVEFSMRYIDEAIMARSFWREEENIWESAEEGVVLYAQAWKPILTNAIVLMLLSYVPFLFAVILFGAPIGLLVSVFAGRQAGAITVIATLIFAYLIKVAAGDAFAMVAIIDAYHRETADMKPNPEMTARLSSISDQFNKLKQRAADAMGGSGSGTGTPPAPDAPAATS
jgi:hypothetical protein